MSLEYYVSDENVAQSLDYFTRKGITPFALASCEIAGMNAAERFAFATLAQWAYNTMTKNGRGKTDDPILIDEAWLRELDCWTQITEILKPLESDDSTKYFVAELPQSTSLLSVGLNGGVFIFDDTETTDPIYIGDFAFRGMLRSLLEALEVLVKPAKETP
jgi:hypothetical protein